MTSTATDCPDPSGRGVSVTSSRPISPTAPLSRSSSAVSYLDPPDEAAVLHDTPSSGEYPDASSTGAPVLASVEGAPPTSHHRDPSTASPTTVPLPVHDGGAPSPPSEGRPASHSSFVGMSTGPPSDQVEESDARLAVSVGVQTRYVVRKRGTLCSLVDCSCSLC